MRARWLALWDAWVDKDHGWLNARLMSMLGMFVGAAVVLVFAARETLTIEFFFAFLTYAGGSASFFKHVDNRTTVKQLEIEAGKTGQ